jgi:hypothetical protein
MPSGKNGDEQMSESRASTTLVLTDMGRRLMALPPMVAGRVSDIEVALTTHHRQCSAFRFRLSAFRVPHW